MYRFAVFRIFDVADGCHGRLENTRMVPIRRIAGVVCVRVSVCVFNLQSSIVDVALYQFDITQLGWVFSGSGSEWPALM